MITECPSGEIDTISTRSATSAKFGGLTGNEKVYEVNSALSSPSVVFLRSHSPFGCDGDPSESELAFAHHRLHDLTERRYIVRFDAFPYRDHSAVGSLGV